MNVIIGYGFVGKATEYLFRDDYTFEIHDPALGYIVENWEEVSLAFLCVPTPLKDGHLDISILQEVYNSLPENVTPIIRSTIGPDQVDLFPRAVFMPEFLREASWQEDVDSPFIPIIVGGKNFPQSLIKMFYSTNKDIDFMSGKEAMMFKLARNSALAMTVALANEFYQICLREEISYSHLHTMLLRDEVLANSHWSVPGPDGNLGFGGKCLPKDLTHMSSLCDNDYNIMDTALQANRSRRND